MTNVPNSEAVIYNHTPDMPELSGMGGNYETACQAMLNAGVHWALANPDVEIHIGEIIGVYGMLDYINEGAKELEAALIAAVAPDSPTGAMMHAVTERVFFVHHHGWEAYCEALRNAGQVDIIKQEAPMPEHRKRPPEDLDLVDALQHVFGAENVVIIDVGTTPAELDAALDRIFSDDTAPEQLDDNTPTPGQPS